jgi:hypothetical protein
MPRLPAPLHSDPPDVARAIEEANELLKSKDYTRAVAQMRAAARAARTADQRKREAELARSAERLSEWMCTQVDGEPPDEMDDEDDTEISQPTWTEETETRPAATRRMKPPTVSKDTATLRIDKSAIDPATVRSPTTQKKR